MGISLTESAAKQIQKQLENRGHGLGLRLGVKKSGCTGFAYVIDFADEVSEDDKVFESHGVKVVASEESMSFLDGTELDYTREGINEAFRFHNPNVKESCGCGESFSV